jgi:hypothetical protein
VIADRPMLKLILGDRVTRKRELVAAAFTWEGGTE